MVSPDVRCKRKSPKCAAKLTRGMHGTVLGEQTLRVFAEAWLTRRQHRLRSKIAAGYGSLIARHLTEIGEIPLTQLKPSDIQSHYGRKLQAGLSPTTVHHIHAFLHVILEHAVKLGVLLRNYTDHVDPPGLKPAEIQPLSEAQARQMLVAVRGHPYEAIYVTALATGMREGELLGLRWEDVDFVRARVRVERTLRILKGQYLIEPPKSASSRRTLPIPSYALAILQQRQVQQEADRDQMGVAWQDHHQIVFTTAAGAPVRYDTLIRQFRGLIAQVGLPPKTRIHDLRHTFATLLIERGVSIRVVSELLGHSGIAITLQTYGHVTPRMREGAIQEMTDILQLPEGWTP